MQENKDNPILNNLKQASRDNRGYYLEVVTEFEWVIELYLAGYFAGKNDEKFNDFISLVIKPNITFRNKVETFKIIADRINREFRDKNKKLDDDFQAIIHDRNVLAHDPLDTRESALASFNSNKQVSYWKFKPKKNKIENIVVLHSLTEFTDKIINDKIKIILDYTNDILTLIEKNDKAHP